MKEEDLVAKWWLWPSALSLEAPAIALAWQDLLARSHGTTLRLEGRCALGLAVWAVYLADRLIDVQFAAGSKEPTPHLFCRGHRRLLIAVLSLVALAGLVLATFQLRPQLALNGAMLAFAVFAYLAFFSWRRALSRAKPLAAAVLFTAGVFLVAWTFPSSPMESLAADAGVFLALCLGNLMLARSATAAGCGMAVLALVCIALNSEPGWYHAAAAGAAGLAIVALLWRRLPGAARGVLADVALLIPALRLWTQTG